MLRFNYQQHTHTFGTANITVRALCIMCIIFSPMCPPYVGPCQSRLKVFSNIKVSALGKIKVLRRWEKTGTEEAKHDDRWRVVCVYASGG